MARPGPNMRAPPTPQERPEAARHDEAVANPPRSWLCGMAVIVDVRLASMLAVSFLMRKVSVLDGCVIVLVAVVRQQVLDLTTLAGVRVVCHMHVIVAVYRCGVAVLLESFAWHDDSFPVPPAR